MRSVVHRGCAIAFFFFSFCVHLCVRVYVCVFPSLIQQKILITKVQEPLQQTGAREASAHILQPSLCRQNRYCVCVCKCVKFTSH